MFSDGDTKIKRQPTFGISTNLRKLAPSAKFNDSDTQAASLKSMVLVSGTAHRGLAEEVSRLIGMISIFIYLH